MSAQLFLFMDTTVAFASVFPPLFAGERFQPPNRVLFQGSGKNTPFWPFLEDGCGPFWRVVLILHYEERMLQMLVRNRP